MENVSADFTINENQPLQAEYMLGESEHFDCSFELFASGTVWGSIDGNIENQTDLWNILNSKADVETVNRDLEVIEGEIDDLSFTVDDNYTKLLNRFENDEQTISDNYSELDGKITSINNTILTFGDIVTYNAASFATSAQGSLADTALQPNDNISELVNNVGYITSASLPTVNNSTITIQKNGETIESFSLNQANNETINITVPTQASDIGALPSSTTIEDLTTQAQMDAINSGATSVNIAQITSNAQAISTETTNRQNADNNLQSQIDAITASSDVTDIVGTYAQLQAYDTSSLPPNSIIKVLQDENRNDETTYYRWVITSSVGAWVLIGEEGPYYTKSEADGKFVPKTRTVNGKALSSNISLDASDVNALPSSTVIPTVNNGELDIQVNGVSVGTFTANQSGNTTANIVVPDSATWGNITGTLSNQTDLQNALDDKQDNLTAGTDLEITNANVINFTNNSGFITGIDNTDVITALGYTPYDDANPNGYTSNIGTVTSVNNTLPDANGNVTISTGGTVDQTYSPSSPNAQSGVAINGAKFIRNYASSWANLNIEGISPNYAGLHNINIGQNSLVNGNYSVALGYGAGIGIEGFNTGYSDATAIGSNAKCYANNTIQLGGGSNETTNTLQVGSYQLLNTSTGLIPDARISTNIARTSDIPTATSDLTNDSNFIQNVANGTGSISVLGTGTNGSNAVNIGNASKTSGYSVSIGYNSNASTGYSICLGSSATSTSNSGIAIGRGTSVSTSVNGVAIGRDAKTTADYAIQLGKGTNSTASSLSIGFDNGGTNANYQLLDGTTGLIPDARISSNIARTSQIPDVSNFVTNSSLATTLGNYVEQYSDAELNSLTLDSSLTMGQTSILSETDPDEGTDNLILSATNNINLYGNTLTFNNDVVATQSWVSDEINSVKRNVGEIVQSTIPLTDAGLHLLDGSLLAYGSYQAFIDYIADLYDSGNYTDIFDTESNWQSSVTTYGVCGKFVYDSVNQTVRLPKITGFTEGTIDPTVLGDLVEAGLPNIIGNWQGNAGGNYSASGAVSSSPTTAQGWGNSSGSNHFNFTLNASTYNSIYGNSNTVQPQAIKVLVYIVVATSTKTSIRVDIDEIATDLNGKADVSLSNVNETGTSTGAGWAMLSDTYVNLTLGASGSTYTAPANGWYYVHGDSDANNNFHSITIFYNTANNWSTPVIRMSNSSSSAGITGIVPVKKGQQVRIEYSGVTMKHFSFIYAQGSESEAN